MEPCSQKSAIGDAILNQYSPVDVFVPYFSMIPYNIIPPMPCCFKFFLPPHFLSTFCMQVLFPLCMLHVLSKFVASCFSHINKIRDILFPSDVLIYVVGQEENCMMIITQFSHHFFAQFPVVQILTAFSFLAILSEVCIVIIFEIVNRKKNVYSEFVGIFMSCVYTKFNVPWCQLLPSTSQTQTLQGPSTVILHCTPINYVHESFTFSEFSYT
jgi:hypothetical protein